jgi:hypothetical protein
LNSLECLDKPGDSSRGLAGIHWNDWTNLETVTEDWLEFIEWLDKYGDSNRGLAGIHWNGCTNLETVTEDWMVYGLQMHFT